MYDFITQLFDENVSTDTGGNGYTLTALLNLGMNIVIGVGVAFAIIFFVAAGIKFITSSGDPKAAQAAKQALTYSVVAFVLVLAAFAVRILVLYVIGAEGDVFYEPVPDVRVN